MKFFFTNGRIGCGCRYDRRNQAWRLCATHLEDAAREAQEADAGPEAYQEAATVVAGEEPF